MSTAAQQYHAPVPGSACTRSRIAVMGALIAELRGRLDLRGGGPMAAHFDDLYEYMGRRLTAAGLQGSPEILDEVSHLLREVRTAWNVLTPHAHGQRVPVPAIRE